MAKAKVILHFVKDLIDDRTGHRKYSVRKGVLRNFAKFTGKHLVQSLFFNKVAGLSLVKNKTLAQVFFCEFCEISNNTFFTEYLWLLLYWYVTDYMLFERLKNTFKNCSLYTIPITLFYSNLELHSPTKSLLLDVPHKYKKALCSIRIFNFFLMFLLRHHISKLNSIIKPQRRKCFF